MYIVKIFLFQKTNKMLLHWLKLWDKSVFGNDYLSKVKLTKEKYAKLGNCYYVLYITDVTSVKCDLLI